MKAPAPYSAFDITTDALGHVDIAMPIGSPVYALRAGKVITNDWQAGGAGYYVTLREADGATTTYMHLNSPAVLSIGEMVAAQQQIAQSGNTGLTTGPHLHLGAHDSAGNPIDPLRGYRNSDSWLLPAGICLTLAAVVGFVLVTK